MRKLVIHFFIALLLCIAPLNYARDFQRPHLYGPTTASDHLWQLARQLRPAPWVTPQQMMVALLRLNPHAFNEHNINSLRKGVWLRIPYMEQVRRISPLNAEIMVAQQNHIWHREHATVTPEKPKVAPTEVKTETAVATPATVEPQSTVSPNPVVDLEIIPKLKVLNEEVKAISTQLQMQFERSRLKVNVLEDENMILKKQVAMISNQMSDLRSQVYEQQATLDGLVAQVNDPGSRIQQFFTNYGMIVSSFFALLSILLIVRWVLAGRHIELVEDKPTSKQEEDPDLEDEYDFINSEEGIPAKINLARAYIDMDEFEAAKKLLKEVLEHGNDEQKQQATHLLNSMRSTTTA